MINGFIFFWLVVFAVIGILCTLIGAVGLFAAFYMYLQIKHEDERETRKAQQEYEGMRRSLLSGFEEMT
jgi:predicted membrane protein